MIEFDTSLYTEEAVIQAVKDYTEIADIGIKKIDGRVLCSLRKTKHDPELVLMEFQNYVLNLSVSMEGKKP